MAVNPPASPAPDAASTQIPLWMAWPIGLIGLATIAIGLFVWASGAQDATTNHEITTTTTTGAAPSNPASSPTPQVVTVEKTTSAGNPRPRPTDGTTIAVLTLGGILVLAAAFFPRISGITLLGSTLSLSPPAAAQVWQHVVTKAANSRMAADPVAIAKAYQRAVEIISNDATKGAVKTTGRVAGRLRPSRALFDDTYISDVAESAVQEVARGR
jgi:hypothetical protein